MKKKSILITGAASGIGRATALYFAKKGWYVGLYDVNIKGLESLSMEIGAQNCCFKIMDVSSISSVKKAVEHFSGNTGGLMNVLFNNAGIIRMGPLESINVGDAHQIIDVNLKGILNCVYSSLNLLKQTNNSCIVNMSSASSLYGTAQLAVYSATKAAVSSLTESMNMEFERHGIFVTDVRAPYVETPLLEQKSKAPSIKKMGVKLTPADVVEVIYRATNRRKIHNNTKGIRKLQLLLMIPLPEVIKVKIIRSKLEE